MYPWQGFNAIGFPAVALNLVKREEVWIPPVDQKALAEAVKNAALRAERLNAIKIDFF